MTNPDTFDNLTIKAQTYLQKLSDSIVGVRPVDTKAWQFFTGKLSEQSDIFPLISQMGQWANRGNIYLYAISLVTPNYKIADLKKAFLKVKEAKKNDRAYSRLNGDNNSTCFYVGRSQDLAGRFKQHLGYGPKDTFALQLLCWANPFELELEINCAKYPPGYSDEVYQILEDTLWAQMSPLFGRKGMK